MKYEEAVELRRKSLSLIGSIDSKGFKIGEIIIVPADEKERKLFFDSYLFNYDFQASIQPFTDSQVEVWTLDLDYLMKANIVFYNKIG